MFKSSLAAGSAQPKLGYRPEIDGLRAISILSVLLYHLGVSGVSGGFVGVDVFFVISGYLITRIILGEVESNRFSFADFYARRARRILPALFAMVAAATLFAFLILTPKELGKFTEQALHVVFQISNFHFAEKVGYFEVDKTPSPLLHTWSLAVEEQFYLIWPLLIWYFIGKRGFASAHVFAAVIVVSFLLSVATLPSFERFAFYHLPPRAWELALGAALAAPSVASHIQQSLSARWRREIVAWVGLLCIGYAVFFYQKTTPFPGLAAAAPALGAAMTIAASGAGSTFAGSLLSLRPVVVLGLISYSVYLWHWPMIIFTKLYFAAPALTPSQMIVVGALSLLIGWASWKFIERPARGVQSQPRAVGVRYGGYAVLIALAILATGAGKNLSWRYQEPAQSVEDLFGPAPQGRECVNSERSPDYTVFDKHCTFGSDSPSFDVLIWGDSHAHHYLPAVEAWAKARNLTVRLVSLGGCPPFLNDYRFFVRGVEQSRCQANSAYIREAIARSGQVKFVFLGLRFSSYFRRDDRFAKQFLLDGRSDDPGERASHETFARGLEQTAKILREMGITPIVLGEVPRLARDPTECVRRTGALLRQILPLTNDAPCGQFNRDYNNGVKAMSDRIVRSAAEKGGAVYFDAAEHLSSGFDGRVYLYLDDNHLTVDGAMHLFKKMQF